MCEANVYFRHKDEEELIMNSVQIMEPDGEGVWRLTDLFGDQKTVKGHIKEMNLVNHRILFERS
ncbi:MAG: CooT family nickel-binding protein [Deltaproteobacteria bacterium]|jgi:predicted RNA-binding protein|nr:CooT family nickel-binding protein [Deltaproteobacteria bacterium]